MIRQQIQWIEHLEISLGSGQQVLAGGLGKASQPIVLSLAATSTCRTTCQAARHSYPGNGGRSENKSAIVWES